MHYSLLPWFCLLAAELLSYNGIDCFVKSLLKQPKVFDTQALWRRTHYNVAVYGNFTLTLTRSLEVPTPSYVQLLEDKTLSVTSFSLLRKGSIMHFDLSGLNKPKVFDGDYLWPNELSTFRTKLGSPIMLIPDGFLMPGQSDGGIFAIQEYQTVESQPIRLTAPKEGWFYHRATYVKLPNGNEGILTARATKPLFGEGYGELIWLIMPTNGNIMADLNPGLNPPINPAGQHYLDEVVLAQGPDVMFELLDFDRHDETIEVIAAHFFSRKLSIHSLRGISTFPYVEVTKSSVIDTIGRPYGLTLATFNPPASSIGEEKSSFVNRDNNYYSYPNTMHGSTRVNRVNRSKYLSRKRHNQQIQSQKSRVSSPASSTCINTHPTHILVTTHECSYDLKSALDMAFSTIQGDYPQVQSSEDLKRSPAPATGKKTKVGEKVHTTFGSNNKEEKIRNRKLEYDPDSPDSVNGGSLFAYEIPSMTHPTITDHKNKNNSYKIYKNHKHDTPNIINNINKKNEAFPSLHRWQRSTLFRGFKVRGWGGIFSPGAPGFPYVFRMPNMPESPPLILLAGDCTGSAYIFAPQPPSPSSTSSDDTDSHNKRSSIPRYELAFEVECGATVGSAAVSAIQDGSGDVNLFIPAYELNKIHVFRLSSHDKRLGSAVSTFRVQMAEATTAAAASSLHNKKKNVNLKSEPKMQLQDLMLEEEDDDDDDNEQQDEDEEIFEDDDHVQHQFV